jgi:hypothetical protein
MIDQIAIDRMLSPDEAAKLLRKIERGIPERRRRCGARR